MKQHFVHQNSTYAANFTSTILRKTKDWFPHMCLAYDADSEQDQIDSAKRSKVFPEVLVHATSNASISDLGLNEEDIQIWEERNLHIPTHILLDFAVRYPNGVHIIEDDPNQHGNSIMRRKPRYRDDGDESLLKDSACRKPYDPLEEGARVNQTRKCVYVPYSTARFSSC